MAKVARSSRNNKHVLHKVWQYLCGEKGEEGARLNPPTKCSQDTWEKLIDTRWTNEKFKKISAINKANRARNPTNHGCGSKSLPIRVYEKMEENGGQEIDFIPFFKETNYNEKENKWSSVDKEKKYNAMISLSEERASKNLPPLIAEEMSVAILKPRSGIVKGLGMRPSSSIRTTCTSGPNEEVARLKVEMEQQRLSMEQRMEEERNKTLKEMEDRMEQQRLENASLKTMLMGFMKNMGFNGRHPPPHDGSAGLGLGVST